MSVKPDPKALRTLVLYSSGHLGSAIILNHLMSMPEYEVVGVIKARPVSFSRQGVKRLRNHLKKVGWRFGWLLFWQRLIQASFYLVVSLFRRKPQGLRPTWRLAVSAGLPIFKCKNINDRRARAFIRANKPDVIVSAYFSQILKPPVIALPKLGILNVHPGWLPAYKGAMAYFWVLKNGCEKAGVSVHWIDEGIDTGTLLRRQAFSIQKGMTQQNVLEQTAQIGAKLLKEIGQELIETNCVVPLEIMETTEASEYYPMPGSDAFKSYFKQHRFFRIRDVFQRIFRDSRLK